MKIREKAKPKETRFKVKKTYIGWLFIAISVGLIIAGGIYYVNVYGG